MIKRSVFQLLLGLAIAMLTPVASAGAPAAVMLGDLNPGASGSHPSNSVSLGGFVFYNAYNLASGRELWKFDGTSTWQVAEINPTADDLGYGVKEGNDSLPHGFTSFKGTLFFAAFDPNNGGELWKLQNDTASLVANLAADTPGAAGTVYSSWPNQLTVFNDSLYFSANGGTLVQDYELWKFNGTNATKVTNIRADVGTVNHSSFPKGITAFNGALYFMADDGTNGYELWKHDGTNTTSTIINSGGIDSSSFPKYFTQLNNHLYFQAFTPATGYELWRTDGISVSMAGDLNPGGASSFAEFLTVYNGALYFRAQHPSLGYELWKYDGTNAAVAANISSGSSFPKNLTVFNGNLYFAADDGINGWELWKYNGTTASLVTNLNSSGHSYPEMLRVAGNRLYFVAVTPQTGYELWEFDGTTVKLAADINPGPAHSYPQNVAASGDFLFFSAARDGSSNWEPWVIHTGASAATPNSLSLSSPAHGDVFLTNEILSISASANHWIGIERIEFYINGSLAGVDSNFPYNVTTALAAPGSYSITPVAYDLLGGCMVGAPSTFRIRLPNQAPVVSISSPANQSYHLDTQTVTLVAAAFDDVGLSHVNFYLNGTFLASDSTPPFEYSTSDIPVGSHSVAAIAHDGEGLSTTSAPIELTIRVNYAPSVSLVSPSAGAVFEANQTISLQAIATDDFSIARVDFYSNGVLLGKDSKHPYSLTANLSPGHHSLTARVLDSDGVGSYSSAVLITVLPPNYPPSLLLITPTNQAVYYSNELIPLSASAADDESVDRVEFFFNGSSFAADSIPPYELSSMLAPGTYSVSARAYDNKGLSTDSPSVTITVRPEEKPVIFGHPQSQYTNAGATVKMTVLATCSDPLVYQWRWNGTNISNATNSVLRIINAQQANAGAYSVLVSSPYVEVMSEVAQLGIIDGPPAITTDPKGQTNMSGSKISFLSACTGSDPRAFYWIRVSPAAPAVSYATANASFSLFNVQPGDSGNYRLVVSNNYGMVTSSQFTIMITNGAPSITKQPVSQTKTAGKSVVLSVQNIGASPLAYQWLFAGSPIPGATNAVYSKLNVQQVDVGDYAVIITNSFGSVISSNAHLEVLGAPPVITSQPAGKTVFASKSATFTVKVAGSEPLFFQWRKNGTNISFATNSSYTAWMVQQPDSGNYSVMITNNFGAVTSAVAQLIVDTRFVSVAGVYNGLFFETNAVHHHSSGFISFKLKEYGPCSGYIICDGQTNTFSGYLETNGTFSSVINRASKPALAVFLQADLASGDTQVLGTVSDGDWTAHVAADRLEYNDNSPAPNAGSYTMIIPGDFSTGHGYAYFTVNSNGSLKVVGALADGSALQQTTYISPAGQIPLYQSLHHGRGSVLGWINVGTPVSALSGTLSWIKQFGPSDLLYPQGFTNNIVIDGSRYAPPSIGERALAIPDGGLLFDGGNLPVSLTNSFTWSTNNLIQFSAPNSDHATVVITPKTGFFSGSFVDSSNNRTNSFKGVLLQNQNQAAGFFLDSDKSGKVLLTE